MGNPQKPTAEEESKKILVFEATDDTILGSKLFVDAGEYEVEGLSLVTGEEVLTDKNLMRLELSENVKALSPSAKLGGVPEEKKVMLIVFV